MASQAVGEWERFSETSGSNRARIETLGPYERQLTWEASDKLGSSHHISLRSGLTLSVSRVQWERHWTLTFAPDPSILKFTFARGPGPRITPIGAATHAFASGTAQVSRIHHPIDLRFDFGEATTKHAHEELCLEVDRTRLCELMGAQKLPTLLERIWSSPESYPLETMPAPPGAFRLLDEISSCEAQGAARQLYLEGKGLELLATWVSHIDAEHRATSPLCAYDIERLEVARTLLVSRMTTPPSLPELARLIGINEAKLKAGFRMHFGDSVYGYLRRHRIREAHRMLLQGRYTVTEVAMRVGYSNPSKFAAAFKAIFGVSPSQVR